MTTVAISDDYSRRNSTVWTKLYLNVISRATETLFLCVYIASCCTHLWLDPVRRRVCVHTPPTPLTIARTYRNEV